MYGHTNPSSDLAIDPKAELVATSCSANSPEDAVIIIRKTSDWNIVDKLAGHTLTITKMAFSPDSKFLLSVSRDRSFAIYARTEEGKWHLFNRTPEAHARMILTCAWIPDSTRFITASRDGQICIWKVDNPAPVLLHSVKVHTSISALTVYFERIQWVYFIFGYFNLYFSLNLFL